MRYCFLKSFIFLFFLNLGGVILSLGNKIFLNDSVKVKEEFGLKKKLTHLDVQSRARDHIVLQFGYINWKDSPDTLNIGGFNRQFRTYGMYDFVVKSLPHISVGVGLGVAWDNLYFKKSYIDISDNQFNTATFSSPNQYYDKSSINTFYFDIPLELRFSTNIRNYNKAFKISLGFSYGFLLQAKTKGSKLYKDNVQVSGSKYVVIDSRHFNPNRILATARIGYGWIHIYGTYQLGKLFLQKEVEKGVINVSPYSFGIGINGL